MQTSGNVPALYDGVGVGKKQARKKTISVGPGVKAKLDQLAKRMKAKKYGR